jgi:ABC-2 type transport system permease protein
VNSLAGTGALVRLALRRDRIVLPVFIVILIVMVAASASATVELYPDSSSRLQAAMAVNSTTSTLALYGPIHDETSLGALSTFKMGIMGAIAVAVLALFLVVRHTRSEEETGRLELLGATVVGRRAPLTAALLLAGAASLAAGVGTALGLIAVGMPVAGSILMGLGFACLGIAFAAVAGLTAQLVKSARTAAGLAGGVLGASYLLRAVGDASAGRGFAWLAWPSPVGWWQQTRPYAGDHWWVLLLLLGLSVVVAALAYALAARRDFAAGLLPDRPGPAVAAAGLRSPLALAWRLQRGSFFAWAAVFVVLGLVVGGMASNVGDFLKSPQAQELITKLGGVSGLRDAFLSVELAFAGVFASVFGVQAAMRLRSEEAALRAEPVLATAVGRVRWAWSHLTIALTGAAALLLMVGVCAGLASALQVGDSGQFGRIVVAALVQIPAAWVIIGIVAAAFGLVPRSVVLGWVALVGFMLLGEFGALFELSQDVMNVSPFAHVPRMPGGDFTLAPLLWLTATAAGLIAVGLAGFRRRDVG